MSGRRKGEPAVLRPFHRSEVRTVAEASEIAGKPVRTIREWCLLRDIGRRVNDGHWSVSVVALHMHLDGHKPALEAYLAGDRSSPLAHLHRCGVPLPKQVRAA